MLFYGWIVIKKERTFALRLLTRLKGLWSNLTIQGSKSSFVPNSLQLPRKILKWPWTRWFTQMKMNRRVWMPDKRLIFVLDVLSLDSRLDFFKWDFFHIDYCLWNLILYNILGQIRKFRRVLDFVRSMSNTDARFLRGKAWCYPDFQARTFLDPSSGSPSYRIS